MQINELKAAVQASLTDDFDTAFARFCRERGSTDLMEFLLDLVERDVLQPAALQAINEALPLLEDGTLSTAPPDPEPNEQEPEGTLSAREESARPRPTPSQAPTEPGSEGGEDDESEESDGTGSSSGTGTGRQRRRTRSPDDTTGARERRRRRTEEGAPSRSARPSSHSRDSRSGKTGRGYDFIGHVGEGAMGRVVLAKDLDLQRVVAYKEMSDEIRRNKILAAKFYAEAQITAQLDHPNIVPIYSLEENDQGALAYSMKLIKGMTLEKLIQECWEFYDNKKPLDEAHSLTTRIDQFLKVCDAMHYAHSRGVIHRDLKPENIMIGPYGEVYVMDWGIAKVIDPPSGKTPTAWVTLEKGQKPEGDIIIGTPQYMSPEQADGVTETLTPASDQYALGLILYELVSLRQAVTGKMPMAIITRQTEGDKDPLKHYNPREKIPTELRAIIAKATQRDPAQRYESVADFAEDIRRYIRGEAVRAKPDTLLQKLLRWMQNHREITLLGIVAGFLFFSIITLGSQIFYQAQRINAAQREEALTAVLTKVGTQAAIIDGHFVRYEGLLGVLSASAVDMLGRPPRPSSDPLYFSADYDSKKVPNLVQSDFYGMPISLDYPVNVLAKTHTHATDGNLERLEPLKRYYRTLLLRSYSEQAATYTQARADRLIKDVGTPISWVHVGLQGGGYTGYPGHGGYNDIFDPRETPWYKLAKDQRIPIWGAPYIDPNGLGLILPCGKALYDDDDNFLGVAAVELTFDYIIKELLEIDSLKDQSEAFLLNDQGEIVVRSSKKGRSTEAAPCELGRSACPSSTTRKSSSRSRTASRATARATTPTTTRRTWSSTSA